MTLADFRPFKHLRWPLIGLLAVFAVSSTLYVTGSNSVEHSLLALLAAVLFGAWHGGLLTGLMATVASLLSAAYLFIPPIYSFRIASRQDTLYLILAALEGFIISWLCDQRCRLLCAHQGMLKELNAANERTTQSRHKLEDIEGDLEHLRAALPQKIHAPLQAIAEAREALSLGQNAQSSDALHRIQKAEQEIAAFNSALEGYCTVRQSAVPASIASGPVLEKVMQSLKPVAERAAVRFHMPPEMPSVPIVEADLARIFSELLSNAINFRGVLSPVIHISWMQQNGRCVFSIADNGPGMIPFRASQAFILFGASEHIDPQRDVHLGAGLAICRRIIRSYGGEIWIRSSPSRGTTVRFSLPVSSGISVC